MLMFNNKAKKNNSNCKYWENQKKTGKTVIKCEIMSFTFFVKVVKLP